MLLLYVWYHTTTEASPNNNTIAVTPAAVSSTRTTLLWTTVSFVATDKDIHLATLGVARGNLSPDRRCASCSLVSKKISVLVAVLVCVYIY